jgi:hypothetical protein
MSYDVESARINELAQQLNRCLVLQYDAGNVGGNATRRLDTPAIACFSMICGAGDLGTMAPWRLGLRGLLITNTVKNPQIYTCQHKDCLRSIHHSPFV